MKLHPEITETDANLMVTFSQMVMAGSKKKDHSNANQQKTHEDQYRELKEFLTSRGYGSVYEGLVKIGAYNIDRLSKYSSADLVNLCELEQYQAEFLILQARDVIDATGYSNDKNVPPKEGQEVKALEPNDQKYKDELIAQKEALLKLKEQQLADLERRLHEREFSPSQFDSKDAYRQVNS